jgi:predicted metal-binding protein
MKENKLKTKMELFVCNYEREGKECCAEKGSKELTDKLRKWSKEDHKGEIKIYRSGCLGKCSEGIAIACFPQKTMLLEVKKGDAKKIKKGLEEALKKI